MSLYEGVYKMMSKQAKDADIVGSGRHIIKSGEEGYVSAMSGAPHASRHTQRARPNKRRPANVRTHARTTKTKTTTKAARPNGRRLYCQCHER